ncbi:V-type ATP synthase subunit A [Ferroplasma sp.]|uniref:V-type ATP synthase subunit A n=1 Tax=Ferroplasma sp. TaxID=2591003 RepID=UPI00307FC34D
MENKGTIYSISGPVVIATDLDGKMFDVVRVGNMGLVGEVIKIVENKFTIQVYEDTGGLKPGEPVYSTGKPLSVELGPGLLKSIYDGIQRPLDIIMSETGDFIVRGATAPPLDEKKEWDFTPVLKAGDEVEQGYIIGTIQETDIIMHKIMVPYNVKGVIKSIKAGKFKVSDTVCTVESGSEKFDIKLKQIWPVRQARKVFLKFAPEIPLITGQRVIDSFFPVAKGGTVAVPGPFGSGKCVAGNTPLLLGNGSIESIENLYKNALSSGEIQYQNENETLIKLNSPINAYSFYDGKVSESRSDYIYRGKSDSLIKIKTETGRQVKITPVHKLFKLDEEGNIVETEAKNLKLGDHIVSIRKFKSGKQNAGANSIHKKISEDLAELLGLYVADFNVKGKSTFVFTNSDENIIDRVKYLMKNVFNLNAKTDNNKANNITVSSTALPKCIGTLISGNASIYDIIMKSGNKAISSFLKGYYLANGSYRNGNIELFTAGRKVSISLSYLLTGLGILHSIENNRVFINGINEIKKLYYNINSGNEKYEKIESIKKYFDSRKNTFTSIDLVPAGVRKTDSSYKELRSSEIEISNYNNNENLDVNSENGTLLISSENVENIKLNHIPGDFIYFDRLDSIEEITGPFDVYDITTPDFGSNFVGGDGAILLHNTVIQHQLSKWSDADITVYVGCGERGNEMTEILSTFPELEDPKSKKPLMEKTILIANTSNMPVAAREASIYTGVSIAEYYRDMGYDVALMADSTSRWAEALREISGRLEEMPGEEGYPAYLGRRISEFYERSGNAQIIAQDERTGSVTLIGAVSPPGGDLSDPVVQNTLRVTRVFWALDASLASRRHFPSINWLNSYSLYLDSLSGWFKNNVNPDWTQLRSLMMGILQKEAELQEIVQLVGYDSLPEKQKNILDIAKIIREDFLQQNAFDDIDTYCSMKKQYEMLMIIKTLNDMQEKAIDSGLKVTQTATLPVRMKISRMKEITENDFEKFYSDIIKEINNEYNNVMEGVESV